MKLIILAEFLQVVPSAVAAAETGVVVVVVLEAAAAGRGTWEPSYEK